MQDTFFTLHRRCITNASPDYIRSAWRLFTRCRNESKRRPRRSMSNEDFYSARMNDYYHIESIRVEGNETIFNVTLLPGFCAYQGHFPGNPVAPGVCNIQMIKACAEQLTGKRLFLGYIEKCRFSAVITPLTTPQLQLCMQLSDRDHVYKVKAIVCDDTTTYIEFKGDFLYNK